MTDRTVLALLALAKHNIPPDIQELLLIGDPEKGISPGALWAAIKAVTEAEEEAERLANICDVEGCERHVECGFPTQDGYRRTCHKHWKEINDGPKTHTA